MLGERWSNEKEISRVLKPCGTNVSGPVVLRKNGKNYVYDGEGHTQYLGVSGSGKSYMGTILLARSCIEGGKSMLVADSKGEIYEHTACYAKDKGYKIIVMNFRDLFRSDCYNPLTAIYELMNSGDPRKEQVAMEMLDEFAHILYPSVKTGDPFWIDSARSLFVGVCLAILEYGTREQATLESIYQFIAKGEDRFGGPNNTYLKEFVNLLPENSISAMNLKSYATTASETAGGIRSSCLEGLSPFARSKGLMEVLGNDDVHLNELDGETKTAIYIIMPDENPIYEKIVGSIVSQMMAHYIRIAHDKYGGKLPRQLHIILEELGNIGVAVPNLDHAMTAARSRNIRLHIVLQSLSQLETIYGKSKATTITDNADVTVAYRINNWETLTELSRKCGEREIECNGYKSKELLITPTQLGAMENGQALCMISGKTKFITWLPGYHKMFDCSRWNAPEKKERTHKARPDSFKIDQYVKEEKRKRMERMMGTSVDSSPFMPGHPMTGNPVSGTALPPNVIDCRTDVVEKEIPSFDVDDLVRKIDAKIAELEEEERKEKEKKKQKESEAKVCKLVLIDTGNEKAKIIKAVREITNSDLKTALENVGKLPYTMDFNSKYKAKQAKKKLDELGAKTVIE